MNIILSSSHIRQMFSRQLSLARLCIIAYGHLFQCSESKVGEAKESSHSTHCKLLSMSYHSMEMDGGCCHLSPKRISAQEATRVGTQADTQVHTHAHHR